MVLFSKTVKSWVCPSVMAERLTITKSWEQNMYGLFQFCYVRARIRTKWLSIGARRSQARASVSWSRSLFPFLATQTRSDCYSDRRESRIYLNIFTGMCSLLISLSLNSWRNPEVWVLVYNITKHVSHLSLELTSFTLGLSTPSGLKWQNMKYITHVTCHMSHVTCHKLEVSRLPGCWRDK